MAKIVSYSRGVGWGRQPSGHQLELSKGLALGNPREQHEFPLHSHAQFPYWPS